MIQLRTVRPLRTAAPAQEGRPSFVAAASGLVHHLGALYLIVDDEQSLARFSDGGGDGEWIPLLPGDLPLDPELRKSVKADFETLTLLPSFEGAPGGAFLALGSGSHTRRRWGALLPLAHDREPRGLARKVDLKPLYDVLRQRLGVLNIEGAVVLGGGELVLLQRGTAGAAGNALVILDLPGALKAFEAKAPWGPDLLREIVPVALPELKGTPLGFSDGLAHGPDRILFTAVAERTGDPYLDGPSDGSALGAVSRRGEVIAIEPVEPSVKLEGIAREAGRLWLVSDQDDPGRAAMLYEADAPPFAR